MMKSNISLNFYRIIKKGRKGLLLFVILYSIFVLFISFSVYYSIINTNSSIVLPNGYYDRYFSADNPRLKFSFGMKNIGIIQIEGLRLEVKIDVGYYNTNSEGTYRYNFFQKTQFFGIINPLDTINYTFIGECEDFDCDFLETFWSIRGDLLNVTFLISFNFEYHHFFNTIPVQLSFKNLNLYEFECPTCYN